ncbi:velvet factor-domain-containing protein [Amylostereum chailletii]|nr:velvet factor-domain-containing protein [Amylostereum chailletii]
MYGSPYGAPSHPPYPPANPYPQQAQPSSSRDRDPPRSSHPPVQQPSTSRAFGSTLNFTTGQFSGKQVRAELIELQKADLGRKYARKDRRPLDPPPVIQLRLYMVHGSGDNIKEEEVSNYDEINNMGLICHVDLFPIRISDPAETSADAKSRQDAPPTSTSSPGYASSATLSPSPFSPTTTHYPYTYPAPVPPPSGPSHTAAPPTHQPYGAAPTGSSQTPPEDIVHYHEGYPVTEGSKCTESLAGTTFVQAANLDYKGNKVLMFVFSDLAVKAEGDFILRYRCFDLFSKVSGETDTPVWAECYGGGFRVYSTKEFPGLRASTDLTKHLSYFGVRLNLRETERKRRKKVDDPMASMVAMASRDKGKDREGDNSGAGGPSASGYRGDYDD